jgi:hypothetical protein
VQYLQSSDCRYDGKRDHSERPFEHIHHQRRGACATVRLGSIGTLRLSEASVCGRAVRSGARVVVLVLPFQCLSIHRWSLASSIDSVRSSRSLTNAARRGR